MAAQHRSCVPLVKPATAGSTISTVPHVTSRCRPGRCGATEHQRRHPGGPWWRVPGARDGPPESHPADQHPGQAGAGNRWSRAVGVECVGPDGAIDLTADRIVLSAGAIGSAHLLMLSGVGPHDVLQAVGSAGGGRPAGRCGVCRPSGMGAAGELDGDPRAAATGGGADHRRARDQALHSRIRRHGHWASGRSGRPSAHRCGVDAARVPRPRDVGVRRPGRCAGHRTPLRQRAR